MSSVDKNVFCNEPEVSNDRREMLKKLGRFGAYTAPVMLTALQATKAVASSAAT